MPKMVVHLFEIIYVEDDQRESRPVAQSAGDFFVGPLEKVAAVVSLGQIIGDGQPSQLIFNSVQVEEQAQEIIAENRGDDRRRKRGDALAYQRRPLAICNQRRHEGDRQRHGYSRQTKENRNPKYAQLEE